MATAISCRALSPAKTVLLVGSVEIAGSLLGGQAVANTISSITNWPAQITLLPVLASGLSAAIVWNYVTRKLGLPSSSTHALVGGMVGAVVSTGGWHYIVFGSPDNLIGASGLCKVIISLFVSPVVGFCAGIVFFVLSLIMLLRATTKVDRILKSMQWFTVGLVAFGHGANDTQKAMGVILLGLKAAGFAKSDMIPIWVRILTGVAMVLGIASLAPGIIRRVGSGIYKVKPLHALVSQISSAAVVLVSSAIGGPISASQVIASTIVGIGTAQRKKGVHWLVARDMLLAWLLTIPTTAILAGLIHKTIFTWLL